MSRSYLFTVPGLLLAISTAAHAQFLTTGNAAVKVDVSRDGAGLIGIYLAGPSTPKNWLSYEEHSYLTVAINGKFYTNNMYIALAPVTGAVPSNPTGYLQNGKTMKIQDTVRTVWQPMGPNAIDIVQDVYPVFFSFSNSGQIVYKFSAVNHEDSTVNVQAQLLLDGFLSSVDTSNDDNPITTRFGYTYDWQDFSPIPPYFIATERPISSITFPGNLAIGFNNDSLAPGPMGLMQPSRVAYVDWPTIVTGYTWGLPSTFFNHSTDAALLIQWPDTAIGPNSTQELGRGSYGTAAYSNSFCYGNLDAITVHPDHITWDAKDSVYIPSSFPVDAVVWNPHYSSAVDASATQTVTNAAGVQAGPIQIVSPEPVSTNGYQQQQNFSRAIVPAYGASAVTWKDTVMGSLINCSGDSTFNISVSLAATGIPAPILITSPCATPIAVDCQSPYIAYNSSPVSNVLSSIGSFGDNPCNARCYNAVAYDTGVTTVPVKSVTASAIQNMVLSLVKTHQDSMFYSVCVIDSMLNGSATIMIVDSLGHSDTTQFTYCTIADKNPPRLARIVCIDTVNGPCFYTVTDSQAWDRGLDTLYFSNVTNMSLGGSSSIKNERVTSFEGQIINPSQESSFCVTAIDLAGNRFDTCFSSLATASVLVTESPANFSLSFDPSSEIAVFRLFGSPSAEIEIFDILGREVTKFHVEGSYEWNTSMLPAGAYIVRVNMGGVVLSKRVLKN